jgi:hypothetical protein
MIMQSAVLCTVVLKVPSASSCPEPVLTNCRRSSCHQVWVATMRLRHMMAFCSQVDSKVEALVDDLSALRTQVTTT